MVTTLLEAPRVSTLPLPEPVIAALASTATAPSFDPCAAALQVSYVRTSSIYTSPGYGFAEYTFQVRNVGVRDAEQVRVSGSTMIVTADSPQMASEETAAFLTPGGTTTSLELGTLRAGQAQRLTVLCGATPFNSCAGSEVRVRTRDDDEGVTACSPGFI